MFYCGKPVSAGLLAFEEPENGVPQADRADSTVLTSLASTASPSVVTTHSPLFCDAILSTLNRGDLVCPVQREAWSPRHRGPPVRC